ncbi:hypothetical protein GGR53DRAFT_244364 [Hypoxylon sp. FL1150]|nr:hypothetical protein GGR53DRAFT_244364 [Hypoxylon sp. FL1150]
MTGYLHLCYEIQKKFDSNENLIFSSLYPLFLFSPTPYFDNSPCIHSEIFALIPMAYLNFASRKMENSKRPHPILRGLLCPKGPWLILLAYMLLISELNTYFGQC